MNIKDGDSMEIKLVGSTNNIKNVEEALKFGRAAARVCYTEKDFEEVQEELDKQQLTDRLLKSGHHSPFEHIHFSYYMSRIPKILAMVLNNEQLMVTSEKSARYTRMKEDVNSEQSDLYDKWMNHFIPLIDKIYPKLSDEKKRQENIKKLGQENARYMTSVFTPTRMVHTLNLRQLNFIIHEMTDLISQYKDSSEPLFRRISNTYENFLAQDSISRFKVDELKNQTERHLSLFKPEKVAKYFSMDVYSYFDLMSFAALAQAHRHRTIDYYISDGIELGAMNRFFMPSIIADNQDLKIEWENDLEKVSKYDFPQAQLLTVNETGTRDDFHSKMILRLCGHAQYEIMKNTEFLARTYQAYVPEIGERIKPKCSRGYKCKEPCVWGPEKALTRVI